MKLQIADLLKEAYKKKGEELGYHAIKFLEKHSLDKDAIIESKDSALDILILFSKAKQVLVLEWIRKNFASEEKTKKEEDGFKLTMLRDRTYKQVARFLHPDSSTGDKDEFQYLQEIKGWIWSCETTVRAERSEPPMNSYHYEHARENEEISRIVEEILAENPNISEDELLEEALRRKRGK
ncbi:MAG: hypothetical protein ACRCZ0_01255 [Cetobacterium sp.]